MNVFRCCLPILLLLFSVTSLPANNTADSALRLLVLGDSLTAGYGLTAADTLPAQLEAALKGAGQDVKVVNGGVSGDTTAGGLSRLTWALADDPQLVIVALGGNDALRGLSPEQSQQNLDMILTRLIENRVKVIFTGMQAPRNMGEGFVAAFDAIYPRLAKKHSVAFYPFFLEGVALNPDFNQADGIHPNAAGVRQIIRGLLPLVLAELATIQEYPQK